MDLFKKCPRVLLQKLFVTLLLGAGCLAVGAAYYATVRDMVFLVLSGVLTISCIWRTCSLYRMIMGGNYSVADGVCVGITAKPLRRYRRVRIMDAEGLESTLLLYKRTRIKIGCHYRIYFKKDVRHSFGSEYLDTALSGDGFLGIEEIDEYLEPDGSGTALVENNRQI